MRLVTNDTSCLPASPRTDDGAAAFPPAVGEVSLVADRPLTPVLVLRDKYVSCGGFSLLKQLSLSIMSVAHPAVARGRDRNVINKDEVTLSLRKERM